MIRIQIVSYNGAPIAQPLFAKLDEAGGKIGRSEGSTLVLHDSTRTISRTHAFVTCRGGLFYLRNLGTALPVYINDEPLANGGEAAIGAGDEIRIDGYEMRVLAGEEAYELDNQDSFPPAKDNLVAGFGERPVTNPFDDMATPPVMAPVRNAPLSAEKDNRASDVAKVRSASIIPPDFDPFGEPPPATSTIPTQPRTPTSTSGQASETDALFPPQNKMGAYDILEDLGVGPSIPSQSIDELFRLTPGENADPLSPGSPLAETADAREADPLAALSASNRKRPSGKQVQRDDVLELNASYRPLQPKADQGMETEAQAQLKPSGASDAEPYGMVLSWEGKGSKQDLGEIKSVTVPSPVHDRRKGERRRSAQLPVEPPLQSTPEKAAGAEEHMTGPVTAQPAPASSAPGPSAPVAPETANDRDYLLRAFLKGAGVEDISLREGLTPELAHLVGQLLRESTQGTLDLLLARTLTKREVRADLTMIAPRENNPLKFSPDVEVALSHLLAPQGRGFMTPLQAMKDAYDDLRLHQFGFMAGMRAALAGVLERFNPEQLERRLTEKPIIDALLPIHRKARLWNLFAEHYKDISREAEDDFHALFGKEFLRAYRAQIAKLEKDDEK
jgi:FHA domain-containing protein